MWEHRGRYNRPLWRFRLEVLTSAEEKNEEDFCSSWEELVDFSNALFCVSSVAMGTAFSDVEYIELTRHAEVSSDFFMPVIRYVEETLPDILVDVQLLSSRVPSAGAYASKGVLM